MYLKVKLLQIFNTQEKNSKINKTKTGNANRFKNQKQLQLYICIYQQCKEWMRSSASVTKLNRKLNEIPFLFLETVIRIQYSE